MVRSVTSERADGSDHCQRVCRCAERDVEICDVLLKFGSVGGAVDWMMR